MTPEADAPAQEPIRAVDLMREPAESPDRDLHDPALYIGRELSWTDFNDRVLHLCLDPAQRLLERVKMAAAQETQKMSAELGFPMGGVDVPGLE